MPLSCGLLPQRPRPYGPASQIGFQLFNDPQPRTSRPGIFLDLPLGRSEALFIDQPALRRSAADTDRKVFGTNTPLAPLCHLLFDDAVLQGVECDHCEDVYKRQA